MADLESRHQDAWPQDGRGARDHPAAVARGRSRLRRSSLSPDRGLDHAKASAARPADVDRGLVRGSDPAHRAFRHRLAGRRRNARGYRRRRGRDPRGGHRRRPDDPSLARLFEAYRKRTGRDPMKHFAIGDADAIVERIAAFIAGGISKFIMRPAARGDYEMLAQTRRLIEEVLPRVAARWPKPVKLAPAFAARGAA